jgi:hypothetical protein
VDQTSPALVFRTVRITVDNSLMGNLSGRG